MLEYLPLSVRGTASGPCANLTYFSAQLELMLAEYERQEPPPGAVRVRAALDVQHATIDDNAATVTLLAAMHLVSRLEGTLVVLNSVPPLNFKSSMPNHKRGCYD